MAKIDGLPSYYWDSCLLINFLSDKNKKKTSSRSGVARYR